MMNDNIVYFDNNGGTKMCKPGIDALTKWSQLAYNPSSTCKDGIRSKEMIKAAKQQLIDHVSCSSNEKSKDYYHAIYTSGATESNCFIIRSCVSAYKRTCNVKPCIVISSIEHASIIACCDNLAENDLAHIIQIAPNCEGSILIRDIEEVIKTNDNIALISIMFANNEIGTVNNVKEIGALAHNYDIPFHTDASQMFGKFKINLPKNNIDAMSISFYKMYGPMGLGVLFIKDEFVKGYSLKGIINGTQQNNLRGGTENVPAIAASATSLVNCFKNRDKKNATLFELRNLLYSGLEKIYPFGDYVKYVKKSIQDEIDMYNVEYDPANLGYDENNENKEVISFDFNPVEIIVFGPPIDKTKRYIPNTLLISVVKNVHDRYGPFCNIKLKEDLNKKGFVVSIGSACHSNSDKKSHVLTALKCPENVGRGVIRISIGDYNTKDEIKRFLETFEICCNKQIISNNNIKRKNKKHIKHIKQVK